MRLAWATDLHLNFVSAAVGRAFCQAVLRSGAKGLLIGGDTAEADSLEDWLDLLASQLEMPIYFVLGNHDYYGGSIGKVRQQVQDLSDRSPHLQWLGSGDTFWLRRGVALVGHGGWGDARAGDFLGTPVRINDHRRIEELTGLPRDVLKHHLQFLGDDAADAVRAAISEVVRTAEHIVVLTHVPTFPEACWHKGKTDGVDWHPDFCCLAMGRMLREVAGEHPQVRLTVLCGHTHGEGRFEAAPNLVVHTAAAEYGQPRIAHMVRLDDAGVEGAVLEPV